MEERHAGTTAQQPLTRRQLRELAEQEQRAQASLPTPTNGSTTPAATRSSRRASAASPTSPAPRPRVSEVPTSRQPLTRAQLRALENAQRSNESTTPPPHSRQRIPTQVQRSLNFRHLRHKLRPHRSTPPKPAPPACPPHTNHALLRAHGAHVQCKRQLRAQPAASPQHQARHLCGTKNSPPTRQQRLLHPRWTHPSPTFLLKSTQLSREWKQHSLHPTLTPHNRC